MAASFKRSHAGTAALSVPCMQQATVNPCLHRRLLDTPWGGGREELPNAQGQGRWPRGATPLPR